MSYFQTQKKVVLNKLDNEFLAEFDMILKHKPDRTDVVVNALSRKPELANLVGRDTTITEPRSDLLDRIREGLQEDTTAQHLSLVKKGKTRWFWQ